MKRSGLSLSRLSRLVLLTASLSGLTGCGAEPGPAPSPAPLAVGDECPPGGCEDLIVGDAEVDQKTDGVWTEALKCKPIPDLEPLGSPSIVVSLDGLTIRLTDAATGFEKVYPIGPGAIEDGESLTPTSTGLPQGIFFARADVPAKVDNVSASRAVWAWNYSCRFWGEGLPYFAGLPFIRLEGTSRAVYGFHGPIDKFTKPEGGELRRGFVSHGCIRMAADDIVELFALIQGHKTPVRIQKSIDRDAQGRAVDVEDNWMLSECEADADCRFEGGICRRNGWSGRGFCTRACEASCPDKAGYPLTRCVANPDDLAEGICLPEPSSTTDGCRRYGAFAEVTTPAFNNPDADREVCMPGPQGFIGSRCLADSDCDRGRCAPLDAQDDQSVGVCSEGCSGLCPDSPGAPSTFCVEDPLNVSNSLDGMCAAVCNLPADCPLGFECAEAARLGQPDRVRKICAPAP